MSTLINQEGEVFLTKQFHPLLFLPNAQVESEEQMTKCMHDLIMKKEPLIINLMTLGDAVLLTAKGQRHLKIPNHENT